MPGKPGWCAVNRGGVPENYNTVAIRLIDISVCKANEW